MPMGRHGNEVALLAHRAVGNLLGRIAARENCLRAIAILLERLGHTLDVLPVALHFFRLTEIELVDVAGRPPVGDVDQHYRRVVARARQLPDVIDDHFVVRRVVDGNEYALIHQLTGPWKICSSSQMLSAAMVTATAYASTLSQAGFASSPILSLSDVNATRGNTANESCMLNITWLSTSSFAVPPSPYINATTTAGTIAIPRVRSRRRHGGRRMLRNPSITIWPARVPVMVEFCPDARSAMANTTLAPPPRSGVSSLNAS